MACGYHTQSQVFLNKQARSGDDSDSSRRSYKWYDERKMVMGLYDSGIQVEDFSAGSSRLCSAF